MTNQSFEATIQYAHSAIKGAIILNGGACLALLTFIGNIKDVTLCTNNGHAFSTSLIIFAIGALCAAITSALAYFSQGYENEGNESCYKCFRNIAVIVYSISLILFAVGIYLTQLSFINAGI